MKLLHQLLMGVLLLCLNLTAWAQTETDTTFASQMNYIFANVEKNRVPYGILRDYGMEFTNMDNYNGTAVLADSNFIDPETYWDVYNTLIMSTIHSSATGFIRPDTIANRWFNYRQSGLITLSGLFFNYSRFRDDAANNYITITNNQLYDKYVSGVWQNPYQTEKVFLLSPSVTDYEGKSFEVFLPSDLWLTNNSSTVSSINIDLGDGLGYRAITLGTPISVSYSDTGYKEWKYKLMLTDNSVLYSHSQIYIKQGVDGNSAAKYMVPSEAITADDPYLGIKASGYITIDYANSDKKLRKPLIVAEGFDPGHIFKPEQQQGIMSINNFITDATDDIGGKLMGLLSGSTQQYDIVYVDWKNGTDYIQRNALLLETVIKIVNQRKADALSTEPNVVLGQSMGGVIARYALKDMENKGEHHQVRLFISHDAPQQGANVPEGYQHLGRHARDLYVKTGQTALLIEGAQLLTNGMSPYRALSLADEPASKQMLINYVNGTNTIDNSFHNSWETELQNLGYPQGDGVTPFRKVVVSNGSECGTPQAFSAGDNLLTIQGKANTRFLGDIAGTVVFPIIGSALGQPALLLGTLNGRNDFVFDVSVNAQADGVSNQVYKGKITYTKKVLWLIPITVTITNRSYNSNASTLPYDNFPGGYYDLREANLDLSNSAFHDALIKYNITASNKPTFNFVPTTSALDIGAGATILTKSDYLAQYVGAHPPSAPKSTPFENFITAFNGNSDDEEHISIERRNGDWMADELNGIHPSADCSAYCGLQINGVTCFSGSYTYSVPVTVDATTTVTWIVSNPSIATISPVGNQATLTQQTTGTITLTALISAPCGSFNVSKTITVGIPVPTITSIKTSATGEPTTYEFTATSYPGVTYNWYVNNVLTQSGPDNTFDLLFSCRITKTVKASITNSCGTSAFSNSISQTGECVRTGSFTLSPNPASSTLTASSVDQSTPDGLTDYRITELKIYDQKGTLRKQKKFDKLKNASLNISDLPSGIYIVEVSDGDYKEKKQLIIQK
jgi:hypothetical protein